MISAMRAMKEDRRWWKCPFFLACLNGILFCGAGEMAHWEIETKMHPP